MKVGDELIVSIQGISVTTAFVEEIDTETATIVIPGVRVVMGLAHSLTDEAKTPETDRILSSEVEQTHVKEDAEQTPVASTPAPVVESTTVGTETYVPLAQQKLDDSAID